jgi:hypothetical protein
MESLTFFSVSRWMGFISNRQPTHTDWMKQRIDNASIDWTIKD